MDRKKILDDPHLANFVKGQVKRHPLYEIVNNINTYIDECKVETDPEAWTMLCYHINSILSGQHPMNYNQFAEGWLYLGELRCQCRMVSNADPKTEEQDEIFYRDNPDQLIPDFESFIGMTINALSEYAGVKVPPKHLMN